MIREGATKAPAPHEIGTSEVTLNAETSPRREAPAGIGTAVKQSAAE